jgi:hypothetical protein
VLTDEKISIIEEQYGNQNNKIMLKRPLRCVVRVHGGHHPSHVMVWWEVSHHGSDTSSFLHERGENGVRVYQEGVLLGVMKQINMTLFSGQEWAFQ